MQKNSLDKPSANRNVPELAVGTGLASEQAVYGVEQKQPSSPPASQTDLTEVLRANGLWLTRRDHRVQMAWQLEQNGFTCSQIDHVCKYVMRMASDPRIGAGELVNLLRDTERLRNTVKDMSHMPSFSHPGEADRKRTTQALRQERNEWSDADREHYVKCRRADGVADHVALQEWNSKNGG